MDELEKIWCEPKEDGWPTEYGYWYPEGAGGGTPYIREDIHEEKLKEAYERGLKPPMINLEELRKTLEGATDGPWTFSATLGIVDSHSGQVADCIKPEDGHLIIQAPALADFTLEAAKLINHCAMELEREDARMPHRRRVAGLARALLQNIEGGE